MLDTVPDAMIVIDSKAIIHSFSAAAERLFGYTEPEVIGQNVSIADAVTVSGAARRLSGRDTFVTGEKRIIGRGRVVVGLRRDGSTFPMELTVGETRSGETPLVRRVRPRPDRAAGDPATAAGSADRTDPHGAGSRRWGRWPRRSRMS